MAFETPQVETVFHALVLILDLNQELVSATKLSLQYTQTPFFSPPNTDQKFQMSNSPFMENGLSNG